MTDAQAKTVGVNSARRGRKRARTLVARVVSYFLDQRTRSDVVTHRKALEADIRKALLDVNHPARTYEAVDAFIEQKLSNEVVDNALMSGKVALKM